MESLSDRIEGKDSVSGTIAKITIVTTPDAKSETGLLTFMVTLDSGCSVFFVSSRTGLEMVMERKDRTATFVGEFGDEAHTNLFCDEVYFWDTAAEA
jgi:hypothetical protein